MQLGALLNNYGLQPGGMQAMQQPMGALGGPGLFPQMGGGGMGLAPLLVGLAGSLLGGNQFAGGFTQGMGQAQQFRQNALSNRMALARMQMQQDMYNRKLQAEQAAQEAARAQQQQRMEYLTSQGMDPTLAGIVASDETMLRQAVMPEEAEPLSAWEAFLTGTPEQREAALKWKTAGGNVVNVNQMPGPAFKGLPGGGTAIVVPDPQSPSGYTARPVIPGRPPESETTAARKAEEQAKAQTKALGELTDEMNRLEELAGQANITGIVGPELQGRAETVRRNIAEKIARVLEPTGKLTDNDIEIQMSKVPDPFGPIDARIYRGRMDELRRATGVGPREQAVTTADEAAENRIKALERELGIGQ